MKLRAYFFATLLLVVCGKLEAANQTSSTTSTRVKSSKISGQVFVVTQGRENIKLALVEILAIPEKNIIQHLKAKQINRLEQLKILMPELEEAKKIADAASEALAQAKIDRNRLYAENFYRDASFDEKNRISLARIDANANWHKQDEIANSADAVFRDKQLKILGLDAPYRYFEGLPTAVSIGKTDADGRFTLSLPHGKYAIAATSSRKVFEGSESYCWLVWVDTSFPNQSLTLSNDNLIETKCKKCVDPTKF